MKTQKIHIAVSTISDHTACGRPIKDVLSVPTKSQGSTCKRCRRIVFGRKKFGWSR